MIYVTVRQKEKTHQIEWMDLILGNELADCDLATDGSAGTITRVYEEVPQRLLDKINVDSMVRILNRFNEVHSDLFEKDLKTMYRRFYLPKKTGGMRPIDAPNDELQNALEELRIILTDKFGTLHHTAAFAYVKQRCTKQCVHKHQENQSNWIYKTDTSGFFPSTTLDFTMNMLKMIFPLSEICKVPEGYEALRKALSLGFLNGGLPQGTKLSPYLTNLISIPIDHRIFNDLAKRRFVYTRYADDLHISCVQKFDPQKMTKYIQGVYREFGAPWILKPEKTHYGSRAGHNFMLGVCLNAQNNITVGWKAKQTFKAMTNNLIMDYLHNKPWNFGDVQSYSGLLSYYMMIEENYFKDLISRFNTKYNVSVKNIIKTLTNA